MTVVWIVLGLTFVYCLGHALLTVERCRATHPKHGRCSRAPGHWPEKHAGRFGGTWR